MENATAPTHLQRMHYVTEQFNTFNKQIQFGAIAIMITILNISRSWDISFLHNIFGLSSLTISTFMDIVAFVTLIVLGAIIATYFELTYGKVVDKPKVKTGNWAREHWWVFVVAAMLILFIISLYIALTVIGNYNATWNIMAPIVQAVEVVFLVYKWLKSPTRSIWYAYPIASFLLLLLTLWAAFSFNPSVLNNGTKLIVLLYLNLYLFLLMYLIILVQTLKHARKPGHEQIFLTPDLAIPANSLQIILAILVHCKSANNVYLQQFTGLNRESMLEILFYLEGRGLISLELEKKAEQEKSLKKVTPKYAASLTQSGLEAASALTQQVVLQPVSFYNRSR